MKFLANKIDIHIIVADTNITITRVTTEQPTFSVLSKLIAEEIAELVNEGTLVDESVPIDFVSVSTSEELCEFPDKSEE